jgi:hypothetical protein
MAAFAHQRGTGVPEVMKTDYFFHASTLRTAAWPSCIPQEGMPRVGKGRSLSGTTTE